jgi:hypothetical protein
MAYLQSTSAPPAMATSVEPTPSHVEAAHRVLSMHRRVCVPEPVCRWCLRSWPCPGTRWAEQVLLRSAGSVGGRRERR